MPWEQTARVSIGSHTQQNQIKDGIPDARLASKGGDKLLLVRIRQLLWIIEQRLIDSVNLRSLQLRNLGEEFLIAEVVVGVLVVQRNQPLVCEEDFPTKAQQTDRKSANDAPYAAWEALQQFYDMHPMSCPGYPISDNSSWQKLPDSVFPDYVL